MKNPKKRPNLIYILADDMGYGDISAYNENCPFQTPNLDRLCENGIRFTDAHASSAVCTPSRYSILTGRYNWRSRLKSYVVGGYSAPLLEPGRMTVANLLKEQGYQTAMIGKWHLGMEFAKFDHFREAEEFEASDGVDYAGTIKGSPVDHGFDYYFGISGSLDMPPYVYIENDHFTAKPDHETQNTGKQFWRKGPAAPGFVHEHVLDELTDRVLGKIEEYKENPFFIYFPMPAPHTPILPAERFQGKSGTNAYGDFVLHCDDVTGRITKKLEELGLLEDTIILYTSDNGCSPMADYEELKAAGHNPSYVFRGTKADIYEGGHRVPLMMHWPEMAEKGGVCDRVVCLSDLMATLAEYFDYPLPENAGEDSVSNLTLWKDPKGPEVRRDVVHQSIDGSLSIRKGMMKLEMCPGSGGWSAPKPGEEDQSLPRFQLYDLSKDIGEQINVIERYPKLAKELRDQLKSYILNGRSTPGPRQKNDGQEVWETILWMTEPDDIQLQMYQ